jgi:hypothetical protein
MPHPPKGKDCLHLPPGSDGIDELRACQCRKSTDFVTARYEGSREAPWRSVGWRSSIVWWPSSQSSPRTGSSDTGSLEN